MSTGSVAAASDGDATEISSTLRLSPAMMSDALSSIAFFLLVAALRLLLHLSVGPQLLLPRCRRNPALVLKPDSRLYPLQQTQNLIADKLLASPLAKSPELANNFPG